MKLEIKPATIDNLKDIQALNLLLFKKEYEEFDNTLNREWTFSEEGTNYFKKCITENSSCAFVAQANNKIIGYLVGRIHEEKVPYRKLPLFVELENMLIIEEYRGRDVGTKLYQSFLGWCKAKGVGRIRVVASAKNTNAINFYRKNGLTDYDLILESNI